MNILNFKLNNFKKNNNHNHITYQSARTGIKKNILNKISEDNNINSITLEIKEKVIHEDIKNYTVNNVNLKKHRLLNVPMLKIIKQNNR